LQARYRADEEVRHFCGMLDGLAFLPLHLVGDDGMRHLRDNVPDELETVVDYFDSNYVSGPFRAVQSEGRLRFRRTPPRFPPNVWNNHIIVKRRDDMEYVWNGINVGRK